MILRRWLKNIWITSIAAGIVGTTMWGLIMEVLFSMVDFEEERGEPLWHIVFVVFLVTSAASLVALACRSFKHEDTNKP